MKQINENVRKLICLYVHFVPNCVEIHIFTNTAVQYLKHYKFHSAKTRFLGFFFFSLLT